MLVLEVTDDGLDGTAHLAFDLGCYPTFLLGGVDFERVVGWRIVATVAGIGVELFDRIADELFDRRDDASQRVAVIGVDALHLGGVQAVDFGTALSALLIAAPGSAARRTWSRARDRLRSCG